MPTTQRKEGTMVNEIIYYTVICDNCDADSKEGCEYSAWNDKGYAISVAEEAGFIEHEGNHYCPNCYEYDDNDELVIKQKGGNNG